MRRSSASSFFMGAKCSFCGVRRPCRRCSSADADGAALHAKVTFPNHMRMKQNAALTLLVLALAALRSDAAATPARQPLDSITSAEISTAVATVKRDARFVAGSLFAIVSLNEPPKSAILAAGPVAIPREAFVVLMDRDHNRTSEIVVDLGGRAIRSWKDVAGVQPSVVLEEYDIVPGIVKADPRWQEAMHRRGITNFDNVKVDAWAPGYLCCDLADGSRVVRAIFFYQEKGDSNTYSRPIEGVVAAINLTKKTVINVVDTGVVP